MDRTGSLSVFFPAHNEADNIVPLVTKTVEVCRGLTDDFEIIVVNDGSTDGTREAADELAQKFPEVRAAHHPENRGYGGALITGFQEASKDAVFFTDGDGQFDVAELDGFWKRLNDPTKSLDAVLGYRIKRQDRAHRRLFAWAWGRLIRVSCGFRVRDLDCAFKIIRRTHLQGVALEAQGAMITTELLAQLMARGLKYEEVGVNHYPRTAGEQSGGSVPVILRAFKELFKLRKRLRRFRRDN
jgi:glycosyltransferase involved in cell wall biosynthesis